MRVFALVKSIPHPPIVLSPNSTKSGPFKYQTHSYSCASFSSPSLPSKPSGLYYASLIDNSATKIHLNQIHASLVVYGVHFKSFLITKLVGKCANLGEVGYARNLFDEFPEPDAFLFNAIIRCYSKHHCASDAIGMYRRMLASGVRANVYTFPCVLKACGALSELETGRCVHAHLVRHGLGSDLFVQNGLVAFYAKCGEVARASAVFGKLSERTVVSWTSMISGYAQNGWPREALRLFSEMRKTDVELDWIALVSVLKAFTDVEDLGNGKSIHSCVIKLGLEDEPDLIISLTSMYAKSGQVSIARSFFDRVGTPSLLLWNAMISGYGKNGYAEEAVEMFRVMVAKNIRLDSITVASCTSSCSQVGSLDLAKWMDDFVSRSEFKDNVYVNTALIDMYAKCGSLDLARSVFDRTAGKDVVLWSAMIMGYALHGQGRECINLFHEMKQAGECPNEVTFLGLLTACRHSGLVEDGWELFHQMRDHGVEPQQQHYASVVDLLGRVGHLDRAHNFIKSMPIQPGPSVWGALLTACKIHRHVTLGEYAAEQLFALDPDNPGQHVQLSNLYASCHLWDRVSMVRIMMKEKGLGKDLGYSSIEINGKLVVFQVGDKSHPKFKKIMEELENVERRIKEAGFALHADSVMHDLNIEEVAETLCNHSERLAIAYGLISTSPGTTLRITKNLRACENCHEATKFISKLENREIVVRDANRFHHFKDGVCSCGDFW